MLQSVIDGGLSGRPHCHSTYPQLTGVAPAGVPLLEQLLSPGDHILRKMPVCLGKVVGSAATGCIFRHTHERKGEYYTMRQSTVVDDLPEGKVTPQERGEGSLPTSVLLFSAEQMLQGTVEERQLHSVIHQLFWNPKARSRLEENPDAFIAGLRVLPRVKAILGLMKTTLLARSVVEPEFNWWWGARTPPDEEESGSSQTGGSALLEETSVQLLASILN